MKSILDKSFQYTPSSQTDLKKTFARIRRERRASEAAAAPQPEPQPQEETAIKRPYLIRSA